MLIQNNPPPYSLSEQQTRAWIHRAGPAGNVLYSKRSRKQPRPTFPPGAGDTTGEQPAATLNREWHNLMYRAWTHTLTPTDRAAWASAASPWTLKNHAGQTKTPTAYQLFTFWHSYLHGSGWQPPFPRPASAYPIDTPPDATWPQPTATSPAVITITDFFIYVSFDCDRDATQFDAWLQITRPRAPGAGAPTGTYARLRASLVYQNFGEFNPEYSSGSVVPPWTATPTGFTGSAWVPPDDTHLNGNPPTGEILRAGINVSEYNYLCNLVPPLYNDPQKSMIWDIDPSTGAHRALYSAWNEPPPTPPWPASTVQIWVNECADWGDPGSTISSILDAYPTLYIGYKDFNLTRTDAGETLNTPVGDIALTSPGPSAPRDVGIYGKAFGNAYGTTDVQYPLPGFAAYFWYPGALEFPLRPGTRSARLTLGARPSTSTRHSDWLPFTITT